MRLATILEPGCVVLDLHGGSKREALAQLAASIASMRSDIDAADLLDALVKREEASSTAIADGIAIPHAKVQQGATVISCFGRSRAGIDFESVDGRPTQLFFVLVSPTADPSLHVRWLAHIAGLLGNPAVRKALLDAATAEEVLEVLAREESAREARA
ncbi:MAG: PTS sugar transporter subunit IIA [Deltaproteobacteria bacterium]|nr:PTS sugar transporter subunit IIA [Deltaproteobacteria bacterium]